MKSHILYFLDRIDSTVKSIRFQKNEQCLILPKFQHVVEFETFSFRLGKSYVIPSLKLTDYGRKPEIKRIDYHIHVLDGCSCHEFRFTHKWDDNRPRFRGPLLTRINLISFYPSDEVIDCPVKFRVFQFND